MDKKIYFFLEKLRLKNYSAKVLFFFSIIFLIAFTITETLYVIYQFNQEKNKVEVGIYNASKIRASLIEKRLSKLRSTFATIDINDRTINKLLNINYVLGIQYKGKKYGLFPKECNINKIKEFTYCQEKNAILVKVKPGFIVAVKENFIRDILDSSKGMISIYRPTFYLGVKEETGSLICRFYKIKESNLGVTGCIDKFNVFKTLIYKNLVEGTLFFAVFITVGYIFLRLTNRIILYPVNFLKDKVLAAKIQGIDKVDFSMEEEIKDEFGKLALLLEEMKFSILKYQNQMNLVMETTSKMTSITNDIERFVKNVIDNLENIFTYVIGNVVYIDDYYQHDKKITIYSEKFIKNKIKEDFILELIEKSEENKPKIWKEKGKYVLVYKKKIDDAINLQYALVSRIEIGERDLKYINIILSHLIYSVNLIHLANYDGLTKLLNRRAALKKILNLLEKAIKENRDFSIIILDLDDFKGINDTYGHLVGDEILKEVANILKNKFSGQNAVIGRLGGEEFIIALPDVNLEDAVIIARNLQQDLKEKEFIVDDYIVNVTASFGVASLKEHGNDLYELIRAADISLYKAKREGKDQVISLDKESIDILFVKEFKGKKDLEKAISGDHIVPFFQPIHRSDDKEIVGYEALARIKSENGFLPAEKFIKDIIKFGLSEKLDLILQEKVLKIVSEKHVNKKIFINLSRTYIHDVRNVYRFLDMCYKHGVDTKNIVFEITEEEAIIDIDTAKRFISICKENRIQFALDDFGAGYSTFSYIKHFDVDFIKIDGSLVKRVHRDRDKQIILEGIIHISKKKGIKTIAEKVENSKDFITLRFLGVDYVQGFFLSVPAPDLQDVTIYN